MRFETVAHLQDLSRDEWNRLAGTDNPFVRHEFLLALERNGCVGERYGWWPQHLTLRDGSQLIAAAPAYLKDNNYGEFVFDRAWSDAYAREGLRYYPKLVLAVPYSPVTGPRLLADPAVEGAADRLVEETKALVTRLGLSSAHWLFTEDLTTRLLEGHGLLRREGCQFHWENPGYRDFQDYLEALTSKRRKEVRRERREVARQGIEIEVLNGREAQPHHWAALHAFYLDTFERKWGVPTLNLAFFEEIGQVLPDSVLLVLARQGSRHVAGSFNLRGRHRLFGRHWGAMAYYPSLHFEVCYYRPIEVCIDQGLRGFEAGAQGEHKVSRGFLPTITRSAHWIDHTGFRSAIADFLRRERRAVEDYAAALRSRSPYRAPRPAGAPESRGD